LENLLTMEHNWTEPLASEGYIKLRGLKSEWKQMQIEAQRCVEFRGRGEVPDAAVYVRIGVARSDGDRPLEDLAENAIKLSLEQARAFTEWLAHEIDSAEQMAKRKNTSG